MSSFVLSRFVWPPGSAGASQFASSVVSPAISASTTMSTSELLSAPPWPSVPLVSMALNLALQTTVPSVAGVRSGFLPAVLPFIETHPDPSDIVAELLRMTPLAEPANSRNTHIRGTVTATVTLGPSMTTNSAQSNDEVVGMAIPAVTFPPAVLVTAVSEYASQIKVTQTTMKSPAPDTTGVVYELYQSPRASAQSNSSEGSNEKVVTGVVVGGVCLVVLIFMLIAAYRGTSRKYGKWSEAEKGRASCGDYRSTKDEIREAHRRRQDRNRHSRAQKSYPRGMTQAEMVETFHQGDIMAAEGYTRGLCTGETPSSSLSSIELCHLTQDHCQATSYRQSDSRSPVPWHPTQLPARKIVPHALPVIAMPPGLEQHLSYDGDAPVSPSSVATVGTSRHRTYGDGDVSPLSSPAPHR